METSSLEKYRHVLQLIDRLATIGRHATKTLIPINLHDTIVPANVEQVSIKSSDSVMSPDQLEGIETQVDSSDSATSSELTDGR